MMTNEKNENGSENKKKYYDKHDVYMREVAPLVKQLDDLMDNLGIPHLIYAVPQRDEKTVSQHVMMRAVYDDAEYDKVAYLGNIADVVIPDGAMGVVRAFASAVVATDREYERLKNENEKNARIRL